MIRKRFETFRGNMKAKKNPRLCGGTGVTKLIGLKVTERLQKKKSTNFFLIRSLSYDVRKIH